MNCDALYRQFTNSWVYYEIDNDHRRRKGIVMKNKVALSVFILFAAGLGLAGGGARCGGCSD